ncbi:hypothetical protein LWI29_025609 [Acer saccharum]|uniref:Uncharacterized protein n=1 Tax=Acer saccharum TaxID=4024 RepID=A0AA39TCX1_ACESA|nr:hypothetical protein LWI29_025609 [Acer saccharum]
MLLQSMVVKSPKTFAKTLETREREKNQRWEGQEGSTRNRERRFEWRFQRRSHTCLSRPSLSLPSFALSSTSFHNGTTKAPSFETISPSASFQTPTSSASVLALLMSTKAITSNCLRRLKNPPLNSIPPIPAVTSKKTVTFFAG